MRNFLMTFLSVFLLATPAFPIDLHTARAEQLVGEGNDGYAVALGGGGDVKAMVAEVNGKRRIEYARIAKEKGQTADVVGKVAAQQIIGGLEAGSKYMGSDGTWKTR